MQQVREVEEGAVLSVPDRVRREVVNYFAALRHIERSPLEKHIAHEDVFRLHQIVAGEVMDQGDAGQYRTIRVRVGTYIPPPPEDVSDLMFALLGWWNTDSVLLPPVLSSAILHHRFESIHPFADGNGRTGRALALWDFYRRGFDSHHIFSVDEFYWEDRPRYYAELGRVQENGDDLTSWLEYCAEGLQQTLERVAQRIQRLTAAHSKAKVVLRPRQEELLHLLRTRGSLTPKHVWDELGVSRQGALEFDPSAHKSRDGKVGRYPEESSLSFEISSAYERR